jgi:serine/threonine protein kinase
VPVETTSHILGEPLETITCECGNVVKVKGLEPLSTVECPKCRKMFPVSVRIGQFLLLKRLGQGAMGEVFEAKDITLGRHVAIKVMGRKVAADGETMKNFVREARHLAALNHRNVVQVHSIGVEKGQPYIVMELVPGGRVDQMITKETPGDERRLLEIMIDAASGLEAANKAGLIHGDVKPANILIDNHGQGKIVDFGLARFEESQVEGKIYGTPFYLPPELLQGKTADFRSDLYSLGASFFHALAGRPPFRAKTVKDIVRMRLLDPAPNLRSLAPAMHPKTAQVIAKMLEKDPDDRYASYGELIADLREAVAEVDAGPVDPAMAALHEALSSTDRGASRSGRIRAAESPAKARQPARHGHHAHGHHRHGHDSAPKSKVPLLIIGGVALIAIVIGIIVATSGNGGPPPGPSAAERSFNESFDAEKLDPAWQFVDGGGKLLAGIYRIEDNNPVKSPGIRRVIGPGTCSIDFIVSKIEWPDTDGSLQFEVWDTADAGILVHLWQAQGKHYIELKTMGSTPGGTTLGKTRFEAAPTALKLRLAWYEDTQRWKVTYGLNGDPPGPEAEGSPAASPAITGTTASRYLLVRTEQYGSGKPLAMELSDVNVELIETPAK